MLILYLDSLNLFNIIFIMPILLELFCIFALGNSSKQPIIFKIMETYLIQVYNREMSELLSFDYLSFDLLGNALIYASSLASRQKVVVMWRRSKVDENRLILVAKFY